jgi:hypothetical protein
MGTKGFAFLVGTLAAGALLSGCVSDPVRSEVSREYNEAYPGFLDKTGNWAGDSGLDLLDVISYDVQFGRGFGVNAHITEYLQAGIGWWDGTSVGQRGRAWGMWEESMIHRGLGPFYWVEVERHPQWGTKSLWEHEYKYTGWDLLEENGSKAIENDWSEVGASAQVLAIGLRAAVSPIEAVDFVAGFLSLGNIDIRNDDTRAVIERDLREEKGLGQ